MSEKARIGGVLSLGPKPPPLEKGETRIGTPFRNSEGNLICRVSLKTKRTEREVQLEFKWNPKKKEATRVSREGDGMVHKDLFEAIQTSVGEKMKVFLSDTD